MRLILFLSLLFSSPLRASATDAVVPIEALREEIFRQIDSTPEFVTLAQEAEELGARVWIYGEAPLVIADQARERLLKGKKLSGPKRLPYGQSFTVVYEGPDSLKGKIASLLPEDTGVFSLDQVKAQLSAQELKDSVGWSLFGLTSRSSEKGNTASRIIDLFEPSPKGRLAFLRSFASGKIEFSWGKKPLAPGDPDPKAISAISRLLTRANQYGLHIDGKDLRQAKPFVKSFLEMDLEDENLFKGNPKSHFQKTRLKKYGKTS